MATEFIKLQPQHLSGTNKNDTQIISTNYIIRVEKSCDENGKVLFYQVILNQGGNNTTGILLSKLGYDYLKRTLLKKLNEP